MYYIVQSVTDNTMLYDNYYHYYYYYNYFHTIFENYFRLDNPVIAVPGQKLDIYIYINLYLN